MPEQKRLTAVKCTIKDLTSGQYIKQEGFNPNYILTPLGRMISRARIMAFVVHKYQSENREYSAITIDDGTDTIRAKAFKGMLIFDGVEQGDLVDVIGKVRQWNEEIYIIPEIVYKVEDLNSITLRRLELKKQEEEDRKIKKMVQEKQKETSDLDELKRLMQERHHIEPERVEAIIASEEMTETEKPKDTGKSKEQVLELIEKLDSGEGADYTDIIEESGLDEQTIDPIINELLADGACFEPKPGRIKKL